MLNNVCRRRTQRGVHADTRCCIYMLFVFYCLRAVVYVLRSCRLDIKHAKIQFPIMKTFSHLHKLLWFLFSFFFSFFRLLFFLLAEVKVFSRCLCPMLFALNTKTRNDVIDIIINRKDKRNKFVGLVWNGARCWQREVQKKTRKRETIIGRIVWGFICLSALFLMLLLFAICCFIKTNRNWFWTVNANVMPVYLLVCVHNHKSFS